MSFYDAIRVGASGAGDFEIARSVRFNGGTETNPQQIRRTGTSTVSTYTISMWAKNCGVGTGVYRMLFSIGQENDANAGWNGITDSDTMGFQGGNGTFSTSTRYFRDPAAWFHFLISVNSNNFTTYINGASIKTGTIRSLDTSTNGIRIGINYGNTYPWDGYIADYYLIDGQALTPSSFTETNALTGQLIPKKYSGSFGTEGAHLKFDDNSSVSALGTDSSGNGNNYTVSGDWSVSAGAGNDSLEDTPTNNFCTINRLVGRAAVFLSPTNGNLDFSLPAGSGHVANGSFLIPTSGKWYAEYVFTTVGSGVVNVGNNQKSEGSSAADQLNGISMLSGEIRVNDSSTQTSLTAFGNNDIIGVKVDRDAGTVAFTINGSAVGNAENISSMSEPTDLIFRAYRNASGGDTPVGSINFGQRPFSYQPSGFKALNSQNLPDPTILLPNQHFNTLLYTGNDSSNRDITGVGFQPDWLWIKNRSQTDFHMVMDSVRGANKNLYSNDTDNEQTDNANGHVNSFLTDGFNVDAGGSGLVNENSEDYVAWNWNAGDTDGATYRVVVVSDSGNKYRFRNSANTATFAQSAVTLDLAEGGTYTFDGSDSTMASHPIKLSTTANGTHGGGSSYNTGVTYELDGSTVTESAYVSGYSSATSRKLIITVAASAPTLYYYCHVHSGMGGQINTNSTLGSSNFDGSIQSTVKANTSAGFSIVTYTGNGSAGATVGHGLGVKPDAIIIKCRSNGDNWMVYHNQQNSGVDPEDYYAELNSTSINVNSTIMLNDTAPTSTSVTLGSDNSVNGSSRTYVMYCFSAVDGYSKFGRYYGNFNANGTFIYTGFRPAWLMVKQFGNDNWYMVDNKRDPFNVMDHRLFADVSSAEGGIGQEHLDFLSNGFKYRKAKTPFNNTFNYIYFCFAEAPFKNSRAR